MRGWDPTQRGTSSPQDGGKVSPLGQQGPREWKRAVAGAQACSGSRGWGAPGPAWKGSQHQRRSQAPVSGLGGGYGAF